MLDILLRALRHPIDYFPVVCKRTLILREIIQESTDIYSFIFTPKTPFSWKAGQHGIFYFPNTKIEGKWWRAFSIASAPEEGVVRIATIIKGEPSEFKKVLRSMKQGESITMHGPFGEFYPRRKMKHIVGIAGGIGITPFRALIKAIDSKVIKNTSLTLIYSAMGEYTFKKEFDTLQNQNIRIVYTRTPEEVNAQLDMLTMEYQNRASYFISGSPGMIGVIRKKLKGIGIKNIVNDSFKGY